MLKEDLSSDDFKNESNELLKEGIYRTFKYFDVQDRPLTLLEIHKYLIADHSSTKVLLHGGDSTLSQIAEVLDAELGKTYASIEGFYCLNGRTNIIHQRLRNNYYSMPRFRRIRKYLPMARFLPFIRAIALSGSEALSTDKAGSDIDVLVLTDANRIWTARFFITALFHILGVRRHGNKISNRICLNHYIAGIKQLDQDKNLYTAVEYATLIPVFGAGHVREFQEINKEWICEYLQNFEVGKWSATRQPFIQKLFNIILIGKLGNILESILGTIQRRRIIIQNNILVEADELSFHPGHKKQSILAEFKG